MTNRYARLTEDGNRVQFAPVNATAEEITEGGYLPYEETEKPVTPDGIIPHNYSRAYEEKDGTITLVWKPYPNFEAIKMLKQKLADTDYKVIKCSEAQLTGATMPYDVEAVTAERQEIRDEINRLERCE